MNTPKLLLFDLGGVIVRWVGLDELAKTSGLSRGEVIERFTSSKILSDYEIGDCTDDAFIHEFRHEFELKGADDELKYLWNSWVKDAYANVAQALKTLKFNFKTACLSNTNALHWKRLEDLISTHELFHKSYASHLIKFAKPDTQAFEYVLDDMNLAAQDVWFFDDTLVNIDAAKANGIHAFHVDRNEGVLPVLNKLKLL